jgi:hypothetical protein
MYDVIEHVHKALGIESTWAFVLVVALGAGLVAALVGGFFGWVVDVSHKNSAEYKAEHLPKQQAVTTTVSSSASQSVTVQQSTSVQGVRSASSAQPTTQANIGLGKPSKTAKPIRQAALREALPEQDAKRVSTPPVTPNTRRVIVDGNIVENQPNTLDVEDPGTTFTNNTVRGMDASVKNGAYADNNDFEGRGATAQSQSEGKGADMAAIRKAQTRNQYPGAFPDSLWPVANTVLQGTNSSVADDLTKFIVQGHRIIADFRTDGNAKSIKEKERIWEMEVYAALTAKLGPRFAQDFDEQELASDPQRHNFEGDNICHLIDTKIAKLTTFVNQLRAATR